MCCGGSAAGMVVLPQMITYSYPIYSYPGTLYINVEYVYMCECSLCCHYGFMRRITSRSGIVLSMQYPCAMSCHVMLGRAGHEPILCITSFYTFSLKVYTHPLTSTPIYMCLQPVTRAAPPLPTL